MVGNKKKNPAEDINITSNCSLVYITLMLDVSKFVTDVYKKVCCMATDKLQVCVYTDCCLTFWLRQH